MPIFACRECGCIENTALSNFWWLTQHENKPALCSACDPEIGKWHGEFARRSAAGMLVDDDGHLWGREEGVPKHCKILGAVLPETKKEQPNVG
jgi:hypothetical protein